MPKSYAAKFKRSSVRWNTYWISRARPVFRNFASNPLSNRKYLSAIGALRQQWLPGWSIPGFAIHLSRVFGRTYPYDHSAACSFVLDRARSARFGQRPGCALRQPRDHPQIVRQHAPGNLTVLIPIPFTQQRAAQESVLENGDASLGLRASFLQLDKLRLLHSLFQVTGRLRADRIVDPAVFQQPAIRLAVESTVSAHLETLSLI